MITQCPAYFRFTDASEQYFVIQLMDEEKIEHVRRVLSGDEVDYVHLSGEIVKEQADYNSAWSYHLKPESIEFFAFAIEVCDTTMEYVEENLADVGGALLPNNSWCPWGSVFVDELRQSR